MPGNDPRQRQAALIRELFSGLPAGFSDRLESLKDLRGLFHAELAAAIRDSLNATLAALPQETLSQKQDLAVWLNAVLRETGLCIRCPKTGKPSNLVVDVKDSTYNVSRFRTESIEAGHRVRGIADRTLRPLEFMMHPPRHVPTRHHPGKDSTGKESTGPSR